MISSGAEPKAISIACVFRRIRGVRQVSANFKRKIVPNGAWCCLSGASGAHRLADGRDGIFTFPDHGYNRGRGDITN